MAGTFTIYAYDLLSGALVGSIPARGLQFGQQLNAPGQGSFVVDLYDTRVQASAPLACTVPARTFVCVDLDGTIVWGGIVMTRKWEVTGQQSAVLQIACVELWSYFQLRVQAAGYSAPPASSIVNPMGLWTATPWDGGLIACQVLQDALGYTQAQSIVNGNPLGGLALRYNGAPPGAPIVAVADYVAVTYPFTSTQTVDTIVSQLAQLGYGIGFDYGIDIAYSAAPGSPPVGTINLSYPRRGRSTDQNALQIDLTTARAYSFPEDGTQTANQVYEIGGSGAIFVDVNAIALDQGYPLLERVFSRANAQSQNIRSLLGQVAVSDLTLYTYPPVVPTVTLGLFDHNLPLGSFIVGDDISLTIPAHAAQLTPDGNVQPYDPRFPAGLQQDWRIVGWQAHVPEEGDPTVTLTLNQPPVASPTAPAI